MFSSAVSTETVLYNFEHVPRDLPPDSLEMGRDRSLISRDVLKIYGSYKLWEYSKQNVHNLLAIGIGSELVPLGFSKLERLESSNNLRRMQPKGDGHEVRWDNEQGCIDVLFVGTETPTRQATIRRMRDAGIAVVYPNAAGIDLFGDDLDNISAKSKIVLSLNAFKDLTDEYDASPSYDYGEWKISRIIPLLATSRCA